MDSSYLNPVATNALEQAESAPTKEQLKHFTQLMSRHKPGKEKQKANTKIKERKKAKAQKTSRKSNRK